MLEVVQVVRLAHESEQSVVCESDRRLYKNVLIRKQFARAATVRRRRIPRAGPALLDNKRY